MWRALPALERVWPEQQAEAQHGARKPPLPPRWSHDAYFKALQLDAELRARALRPYALLLLDEAHDCCAAQLDVVLGGAPAACVVYDPHQQIYQFRGATCVRALGTLGGARVARRTLSHTFRYGAPLSAAAQALIRTYKGRACAAFTIRGLPARRTAVLAAERDEPPYDAAAAARGEPLVVIARLNRTLLELAASAVRSGALGCVRFAAERDYLEAFGGEAVLLDVHALLQGAGPRAIATQGIRGFADGGAGANPRFGGARGGWAARRAARADAECCGFERFRHFCAAKGITKWLSACELAERHRGALPAMLRAVRAAVDAGSAPGALPGALFTSTHRAKGLEWARVYVAGDHMARGLGVEEAAEAAAARAALGQYRGPARTPRDFEAAPSECLAALELSPCDEVSALYVALTRAREALTLAPSTASWLRRAGVWAAEGEAAEAAAQPRAVPPASAAPAAAAAAVGAAPRVEQPPCSLHAPPAPPPQEAPPPPPPPPPPAAAAPMPKLEQPSERAAPSDAPSEPRAPAALAAGWTLPPEAQPSARGAAAAGAPQPPAPPRAAAAPAVRGRAREAVVGSRACVVYEEGGQRVRYSGTVLEYSATDGLRVRFDTTAQGGGAVGEADDSVRARTAPDCARPSAVLRALRSRAALPVRTSPARARTPACGSRSGWTSAARTSGSGSSRARSACSRPPGCRSRTRPAATAATGARRRRPRATRALVRSGAAAAATALPPRLGTPSQPKPRPRPLPAAPSAHASSPRRCPLRSRRRERAAGGGGPRADASFTRMLLLLDLYSRARRRAEQQ